MTLNDVKPGSYWIIRVDGSETLIEGNPNVRQVAREIGAEVLDTVIVDRRRMIVMLVDDTGMVDGKPVNSKATEFYHSVCRPGTVFAIHGDAALVFDGDFA